MKLPEFRGAAWVYFGLSATPLHPKTNALVQPLETLQRPYQTPEVSLALLQGFRYRSWVDGLTGNGCRRGEAAGLDKGSARLHSANGGFQFQVSA